MEEHGSYGYIDKNVMVRTASLRFKEELEREKLARSADPYAELYDKDEESRELTESALRGWPE